MVPQHEKGPFCGADQIRTSTGDLVTIGCLVFVLENFSSRKVVRQPYAGAFIRGSVVGWYGNTRTPATETLGSAVCLPKEQ